MEDKREMTREELVLRLNIEESLRKAYQAKYEDAEKKSNERRDKFNKMCDHYRELEAENEKLKSELKTRLNIVYGTGLFDGTLKSRKLEEENDALKGTLEAKNEEIERLRKKKDDQRIQLNAVQQALLNRNMKIEALNSEVDRLKKEAKETRVVFEPTSYMIDIQAKDEEIKTLRKKNLDLKNENEGWKLKYDHLADVRDARIRERNSLEEQIKELQEKYDSLRLTYSLMKLNPGYFTPPAQPINIENLNITYYANGPVWTNEEDE